MTPIYRITASAVLIVGLLSAAPVMAEFDACLTRIEQRAIDAGVSAPVTKRLLAGVTPSERVIELDRRQPEFTSSLQGYFNRRLSAERIKQGQALLAKHADALGAIQRDYGVPARYLVAFWGLETHYGQYFGNMSTVRSLATLACDPRRSDFFEAELIAAMQLVDRDILTPEQLQGSWAGALGNFQFLPSVYRDHAVDADGDGQIDLWNSFADAAESAAIFLRARGWQPGERWGREVLLPPEFDYALADQSRRVAEWDELGIRLTNGDGLPDAALEAELIIPAGAEGPAFLVYPNFKVIMRWNPSRFYALSVGHLADRLIGAPPLRRPPPAHAPLKISTVREMQAALNAQGFAAGVVDGRIGPATRQALRAFQSQRGLLADGYPGNLTLMALGIERANASN